MTDHVAAVRRVLQEESNGIVELARRCDEQVAKAVDWMLACKGRVVCCGLGKSGHVAEKAAATFASTGTPSFFLHASEAHHGDLGMVTKDDIVLLYTYSGETDEIVRLMPSLKSQGARTILISGRPASSSGRQADLILDVSVDSEACPNNLAPTTSTTVMLALSDALAVAAMEARGFSPEDFARFHPAGTLGRRLTLTVGDVMRKGEDLPLSSPGDSLLEVMQTIAKAGAGCTCVVDEDRRLLGIVTEGDLRRAIIRCDGRLEGVASDAMTVDPGSVDASLLAFEALEIFENYPHKIGELPVLEGGQVVGVLMLKDLVRTGIV
ncbi:MAG: KpsF/GutQ family sugar-phosphate isomerase [Armatimonadetes bacterium]|nr:KpsF/GutQ family sugar-phosphate isomerase [Armatimonadota bacterium]